MILMKCSKNLKIGHMNSVAVSGCLSLSPLFSKVSSYSDQRMQGGSFIS